MPTTNIYTHTLKNKCASQCHRTVFLNPGPGRPPTLHILCVSLIKHTWFNSLKETPGPEMGVSDKGDIQNVQCWGCPGRGLRNSAIEKPICLNGSIKNL